LQPSEHASVHPDIHIFKNKVFAVTACAIFLMEFSLFIPLAYITSYTLAQGFDQEFSFEVLTILNAASFLGRTLPGWWADSIGPFNSNIMSVLVSVIACFAVWLPFGHTTAGIVIFAILIGFASGNNISITPTCIGKLCKTQDYGRYYATCFTMVSFACLTGNPIGGVIIAACGGKYWGLIILTGTIYIASLVVFIIAKILAVGWHVRRRF
jgi:predicted MFS family arabinose efflux permease